MKDIHPMFEEYIFGFIDDDEPVPGSVKESYVNAIRGVQDIPHMDHLLDLIDGMRDGIKRMREAQKKHLGLE